MKKNYVLLGLVSLLSLPLVSQAANVSSSIQATANIEASCSINIDNVEFGDMSPDNILNKGLDHEFFVQCSKDKSYTVGVSSGDGSVLDRHMKAVDGSADVLKYNLYLTSAKTTILGTGGSEGSVIQGTGTGNKEAHNFYAYANAQYVKSGNYADTLTLTVNY